MWDTLIAQIILGLSKGALLFLLACGLSVIFGMLNIVNFAHGALFMLGGFLAVTSLNVLGFSEINVWLVVLLASPALVALIGILLRSALIPLLRRTPRENVGVNALIFTIGLTMVLSDFARTVWGSDVYSVKLPPILSTSAMILGKPIPNYSLLVLFLGTFLAFILTLLFFRTKIGAIIRAIAFDEQIAAAMGANVTGIGFAMFALGGFLAGLGGAINAMIANVEFTQCYKVIIEAFIVAIVGGLGSFRGAIVGAFIIGVAESLVILFFARFGLWVSWIVAYVVLIVTLIVRPRGIFGGRF